MIYDMPVSPRGHLTYRGRGTRLPPLPAHGGLSTRGGTDREGRQERVRRRAGEKRKGK
jgi:hypothetical protein